MKLFKLFLLPIIFIIGSPSWPKPVDSHSGSFLKLDSTWLCDKEGLENVCKPISNGEKPNKVIIWSAKEVGKSDSFENFQKRLDSPESYNFKGKKILSTPKSSQTVRINGTDWIDALQWQSEVPGYFTRYLVTSDDKIAVFITFSAHKSVFEGFNRDIQTTIDQLNLKQLR